MEQSGLSRRGIMQGTCAVAAGHGCAHPISNAARPRVYHFTGLALPSLSMVTSVMWP